MCEKVVKDDSSSLRFVPNWFVAQEQIAVWYDDDYWYHDDETIEWYKGYKKRKAQKANIKEELLLIAWHPNRVMDWCMSEDDKRRWKQQVVVLKNYLIQKITTSRHILTSLGHKGINKICLLYAG